MNTGRTVFSQLIEFLPHQQFQKCVDRFGGGSYLKNLSCWDQYLAMAFAQLTYRESLRDIEACLGSIGSKLYHMGFRGNVALPRHLSGRGKEKALQIPPQQLHSPCPGDCSDILLNRLN
jgi:hypothetical protein